MSPDPDFDEDVEVGRKQVIQVQEWAEIRRLRLVEGLSISEIARRTGRNWRTVEKAVMSSEPPRYKRKSASSKLDPYKPEIQRLLRNESDLTSQRIRELIVDLGYEGGKTICDDYVRELRPLLCPPRSFQRTNYRPGEILQFDLFELQREVPVGWGQTRKGYIVVAALGYSRAGQGTLVFSKTASAILTGLWRCIERLGGVPERLVTDREGALHDGGGQPSEPFLTFAGALGSKAENLEKGDCQAKGVVERLQGFLTTNFEPSRVFASELDLQMQLDEWFDARANARLHRTLREQPVVRLTREHKHLRELPSRAPRTDERFAMRVPAQPYLRFDTNDYSLDPRFVGQRVEVSATLSEVTATALGDGELAARHRRVFAKHLTLTDPAHQSELTRLRAARRAHGRQDAAEVEVELRDLASYDALVA